MTGGTSTVAVTTSTGQTVTSTPGTNTKVVDESGNVVAISKNGTATQGKYDKNAFGQGATNSEVAQAATDDKLPKVTLTLDTSKPYYGYDTSAGGEPWVSIQTGKSVSLTASVDLRQSSHKATDIRYRTNDGMVVDATGSNPATLTAKGLYSGTAIPILAVADTGKVDSLKTAFVCGKINTVGYDPEYRRVWLVPVNGAKVDKEAIAKKLSAVYRQAVVEWDVQCDPKTMSLTLTDEELKGICKDITVGIASNYTIEQQAVLKKFGREPEERSYILFMVDGKAGDATGFMPLNRSAGFIYLQGQSTDAVARIVAHELGHGAFGLAHEGRAKDNTLAATDNLMDYSGGTALTKAQWDAIHSEYRRLKWFQDAEEGMNIAVGSLSCVDKGIVEKIRTNIFYSPDGKPINILDGIPYAFFDKKEVDKKLVGTLCSFYYKNVLYSTYFYTKNLTFAGYAPIGTKPENFEKVKFISGLDVKNPVKILIDPSTKLCYKDDKELGSIADCSCDNMPNVGKGKNIEGDYTPVKNLIKTPIKEEVFEKLKNLVQGGTDNKITGNKHSLKARIILTAEDSTINSKIVTIKDDGGKTELYIDDVKEEVATDEVVFWIEYNKEGKIRVKKVVAGDQFSNNIKGIFESFDRSLDWKQKNFFEKFVSASFETVDIGLCVVYDILDFISGSVEKLQISETVYNCNAPGYNSLYADVFAKIDLTSLIINKITTTYCPEIQTILNGVNAKPEYIKFAFFCGLYNGLVDVIKSVPDLAKLAMAPFVSKGRQGALDFYNQIEDAEFKDLGEDGKKGKFTVAKVGSIMWDAISSQFNLKTPCVFAHTVGTIVGPIVVACVGDVAALSGIASKLVSTPIKFIQLCDKLSDPISGLKMGLKFVKQANGRLFSTVYHGTQEVVTQVGENTYKVVAKVDGVAGRSIDLNTEEVATLLSSGEKVVNVNVNGKVVKVELGGFAFDRLTYIKSKLPEKFKSYADEVEAAAKALGTKQDELDKLTTMLGCFTATTPVQTAHGAVPIASVTEADQVLSYNHQAGKTELKRIFNIKRHVVKGLLLLGLSTGQTVEATPNHPFYAGGSYREAATLHVGDTLKAANGSAVILQSVARKDTLATVYNFTVADNFNYFVGEPGVLVHNSCAMDLLELKKYAKLKDAIQNLDDDLKGAIMVDLKSADAKLYDALSTTEGLKAWKFLKESGEDGLRTDVREISYLSSRLKEVEKAGSYKKWKLNELDNFAESLAKKRGDIRDNILTSAESKEVAKLYFNSKVKNYTDFEKWYKEVFLVTEKNTPNFEAHHVIPVDVLKGNKEFKELLLWAEKEGIPFDFNGAENGIMLQRRSVVLEEYGHARHDDYNRAVDKKITQIISKNSNRPQKAVEEITSFIKEMKQKLKDDVVLGNKNVNDITSF